MRAEKPSVKPSGPAAAPVPQPHGGYLVPGAGGGPQPGSGRKPAAVREACLLVIDQRIPLLEQIVDGEVIRKTEIGGVETETRERVSVADRLRAIDLLAKYGLGPNNGVSADKVREMVRQTLDVIRAHTSREQAADILRALQPIWS